jgi:hypothetical protein
MSRVFACISRCKKEWEEPSIWMTHLAGRKYDASVAFAARYAPSISAELLLV